MKITEFRAENVLKLKVVRIRPDGSAVVIGGKNGQGKTSVLTAVASVLEGKKSIPDKAIREGAEKGVVELDFDDGMTARRTFTPGGGGTLTITNKDGMKYASPQKMLETLQGNKAFDPLAFSRAKEKEQLEMLRELVNLIR